MSSALAVDTSLRFSREDIVRRLEEGAQRRLGISAADLVERFRAGTLSEAGRVADLLMLASLLDADDPLCVAL